MKYSRGDGLVTVSTHMFNLLNETAPIQVCILGYNDKAEEAFLCGIACLTQYTNVNTLCSAFLV